MTLQQRVVRGVVAGGVGFVGGAIVTVILNSLGGITPAADLGLMLIVGIPLGTLMLVGGGAGRLEGGRHVKYTDKPTIANLLVTLMDKLDVPVEKIGGSTGKLPLETVAGV